LKLAIKALPNFKPANYTFIGGTEGNDNFSARLPRVTTCSVASVVKIV
jgi:hypothetical protein